MKKIVFVCFFCFLFCLAAESFAETVVMNDGTTYKGNIHHQDDKVVYIIQGMDLIKLQASDVKEIIKDEEVKKKDENLNFDDSAPAVVKNTEFILKAVYDLNGSYKVSGSSDTSSAGIGIGAEFYGYPYNNLGFGLGADIQNTRGAGGFLGDFYFIPVYASIKIRSNPTVPYKYGYAVAHLGYNFFHSQGGLNNYFTDAKGGVCYSAGFGFVYNRMVFELLWSVNRGKIKVLNTETDVEYSKYSLSAGYAF